MPLNEAFSIGIIGGAYGPTAVFVTGRFPWEFILLGVVAIVVAIRFIRRKK